MIKLYGKGYRYVAGKFAEASSNEGYTGTMAYKILAAHNGGKAAKGETLHIKFDAIASHDITYVGIIQTAKAIGLEKFPIPYVLTNCHNSLCAVGGTINEDDHMYGLSAAKKYGGIYVPPHYAVIHTYMRENFAGVGKMILGSDSHTRYGALGTMAVGEGGPELVKQIIGKTYDVTYPDVIAVNLKGAPRKGVGPQDVALCLIGAVFAKGFVKNKVLEFVGDGVKNLPIEFRNGIDVMTTETTCLSSVWTTDGEVEKYLAARGRASDYKELKPDEGAYYDGLIEIDLAKVEPMIALPFHPSNVYTLRELLADPYEILHECELKGRELLKNDKFTLTDKITAGGKIRVDQAVIALLDLGHQRLSVCIGQVGANAPTDPVRFPLDSIDQRAHCILQREGPPCLARLDLFLKRIVRKAQREICRAVSMEAAAGVCLRDDLAARHIDLQRPRDVILLAAAAQQQAQGRQRAQP